MDFDALIQENRVTFGQMPPASFLIGLLSAFDNRFQTVADSFFAEVTWKQFFAIICINLCKESPTINELSDIMGSSHQNVKQILLKLEKKEFVQMTSDESDKRKKRIVVTEKCRQFCAKNEKESRERMDRIFVGIETDQLLTTIQTIAQMERNLMKQQ